MFSFVGDEIHHRRHWFDDQSQVNGWFDRTLGVLHVISTNRADEADTAFARLRYLTAGRADTVETARKLMYRRPDPEMYIESLIDVYGYVLRPNDSYWILDALANFDQRALETDTAFALPLTKRKIGQANETDTALALLRYAGGFNVVADVPSHWKTKRRTEGTSDASTRS